MLVAPPAPEAPAARLGARSRACERPPLTQEHPLRAERPILPRPDVAVLSARRGLTAEFGMESGDPPLCGSARTGCSRARLQVVNQCAACLQHLGVCMRVVRPMCGSPLEGPPLATRRPRAAHTHPWNLVSFSIVRTLKVHVPHLPRSCQMVALRLAAERSVASSHVGEVLG